MKVETASLENCSETVLTASPFWRQDWGHSISRSGSVAFWLKQAAYLSFDGLSTSHIHLLVILGKLCFVRARKYFGPSYKYSSSTQKLSKSHSFVLQVPLFGWVFVSVFWCACHLVGGWLSLQRPGPTSCSRGLCLIILEQHMIVCLMGFF